MILNLGKVERRMADRGLKIIDLARRMSVTPSAASQQLTRIREGLDIKPATAANLARGLECEIDDLISPLPRRRGKAAV